MDVLNIGLVGLGRIADLHARAYASVPGVRLHAICDADAATLARRRTEWGVERATTSYQELLDDPELHAVEILTPHHLHKPMTLAAAAANKHVAVQKPMALDAAECDAMIAAAERAGVVLKVTENFMFHPSYARAKQLIDAGAIGEPRAIRLKNGITLAPGGWDVSPEVFIWRMDRERGGPGVVTFDDGYHKLNVARHLLGEVDTVQGFIQWSELMPGTGLVIDAPACFTWRYKDSARFGVMDVTLSRSLSIPSRYYPIDEQVEVTGESGVLYLTRCTADMTQGAPLILYSEGRWQHFDDLEDDWAAGFRESLRNFVDAIHGRAAPALSGADGKRVVQFARACYRAAESGNVERLDDA